MKESLGQQTIRGVGWSAIERLSYQGITFLIQIVLARHLTPDDYGVVAMLAIFLQIAQVFIDSGFANALIKKQDCTDADYSTVFYYNLGIALLLYLILFLASPAIALFYKTPLLVPVLRVLALTLIFNALSIVQQTRLVKQVDFKSQSVVTFTSAVVSGAVGIYFACRGLGAWALVIQQLLNSILRTVIYWAVVRWMPRLIFSMESFRYLFGFGSKLLVSTLIDVIYKNLYKLVIGKRFMERDLGFYTKAEEFAIFPSTNAANIISRVCFPILSRIQDDDARLSRVYRSLIRYSSWGIFPMMIGLLAVSEPFIITFLKEPWAPAVPILRILCLDWMLDFICVLNLNLLFVKGRTDLVLNLQIVKKIIALSILFMSVPFGLVGMCWGRVIYSVISVCINTYYTKRLIGLGLFSQLGDIIPFMLASAVMGVLVYVIISQIDCSQVVRLTVGILTGVFAYTLISFLFFKSEMKILKDIRRIGNE
jgi:O-antigen/teichoic acid export membrane protein